MAKWLLFILLLLSMARIDDVEIGGKEYGPVRFRLSGDREASRQLIGLGREVLGNLKQRMQLGELTQLSTRPLRLDTGAIIQAHSRFGEDGMPDMDEVWIFSPSQPAGRPSIKIITFAVYFKPNTITIPVEEVPQTVTRRAVTYFVGEPYQTTGGGLRFFNNQRGEIPGYLFFGQYEWDTSLQGEDYSGIADRDDDVTPLSPSNTSYIPMYRAVSVIDDEPFWAGSNMWGQVAASNYGLYTATNNCFDNTMDDGYTYDDGYVGKIGHATKEITYDLDIPESIYDMLNGDNHNDLLPRDETYQDDLPMEKSDILPGWYGIGAMNERDLYAVGRPNEEEGPSPDSDTGSYTLWFELSNGDVITYDFDVSFSFTGLDTYSNTLANKVVLFNVREGLVKEYDLESYETSPFYDGINDANLFTSAIQKREIPDSIKPTKVYDVFANYRESHDIEN